MPFFVSENKQHHIIDENKYMPIAVIYYTDSEGINTPLQLKMELPD